MLGNVTLRRADQFNDVLHADFLVTKCAKNFEPERMGHGFHRLRRPIDIFVAGGQKRVVGTGHAVDLWDAGHSEADGGLHY